MLCGCIPLKQFSLFRCDSVVTCNSEDDEDCGDIDDYQFDVQLIINNQQTRAKLLQYMKREHVEEFLNFLIDCEAIGTSRKFTNNNNNSNNNNRLLIAMKASSAAVSSSSENEKDKLNRTVLYIYNEYINSMSGSTNIVNLSGSIVYRIERSLEVFLSSHSMNVNDAKKIFEPAMYSVMQDIRHNVLARFVKSEEWRSFVRTKFKSKRQLEKIAVYRRNHTNTTTTTLQIQQQQHLQQQQQTEIVLDDNQQQQQQHCQANNNN